MVLILAAVIVAPAVSQYCYLDGIGFYTEPDGDFCEMNVEPFVPFTIYIVAEIWGHLDPISHLEFQIDDMPDPTPSEGSVILTWMGDIVVGDLETGVVITFDPDLILPFCS